MSRNICINPNPFRKQMKIFSFAVFLGVFLFFHQELHAVNSDECLLEALKYAEDSATVKQLREQCQEETGTVSKAKPHESSTAEIGSHGPPEIILKTAQARKPAYFPHRKHQDKYYCGTCHHGRDSNGRLIMYTQKTVIYKCTYCHNIDMQNDKLNGFQLIGHKLCRECHRKNQNITSAKCGTCHRKNL